MKKTDVTTAQAARMLGVTRQSVVNMIKRGSLHAYKLDPKAKSIYYIPRKDIESVLKARAGSSKTSR